LQSVGVGCSASTVVSNQSLALQGAFLFLVMKLIPLSRGLSAMVDDADFDFLNQWKWQALKKSNTFYAVRTIEVDGVKKGVRMHRFLLQIHDPCVDVDHRDGNGLNNQRFNIRPCAHGENMMNRTINAGSKTGYKGVTFRSDHKNYRVRIGVAKKVITIGHFDCPIEAARAYNDAAILYHGEFARLNDL